MHRNGLPHRAPSHRRVVIQQTSTACFASARHLRHRRGHSYKQRHRRRRHKPNAVSASMKRGRTRGPVTLYQYPRKGYKDDNLVARSDDDDEVDDDDHDGDGDENDFDDNDDFAARQ